MGTPAFMDFVESIQSEGVTFEHVPMGGGATAPSDSLVVEVDAENPDKDLDALDIAHPRLTRRFQPRLQGSRRTRSGRARQPAAAGQTVHATRKRARSFSRHARRARSHHTIQLDGSGPADYRSVVAFFARQLLKDLRLVGGYDVLYRKVQRLHPRAPVRPSPVDLEDPVVLRNLSEPDAGKILFDSFKAAHQRAHHSATAAPRASRTASGCATPGPSAPSRRAFLPAKKSVFNKIVGEAQRTASS